MTIFRSLVLVAVFVSTTVVDGSFISNRRLEPLLHSSNDATSLHLIPGKRDQPKQKQSSYAPWYKRVLRGNNNESRNRIGTRGPSFRNGTAIESQAEKEAAQDKQADDNGLNEKAFLKDLEEHTTVTWPPFDAEGSSSKSAKKKKSRKAKKTKVPASSTMKTSTVASTTAQTKSEPVTKTEEVEEPKVAMEPQDVDIAALLEETQAVVDEMEAQLAVLDAELDKYGSDLGVGSGAATTTPEPKQVDSGSSGAAATTAFHADIRRRYYDMRRLDALAQRAAMVKATYDDEIANIRTKKAPTVAQPTLARPTQALTFVAGVFTGALVFDPAYLSDPSLIAANINHLLDGVDLSTLDLSALDKFDLEFVSSIGASVGQAWEGLVAQLNEAVNTADLSSSIAGLTASMQTQAAQFQDSIQSVANGLPQMNLEVLPIADISQSIQDKVASLQDSVRDVSVDVSLPNLQFEAPQFEFPVQGFQDSLSDAMEGMKEKMNSLSSYGGAFDSVKEQVQANVANMQDSIRGATESLPQALEGHFGGALAGVKDQVQLNLVNVQDTIRGATAGLPVALDEVSSKAQISVDGVGGSIKSLVDDVAAKAPTGIDFSGITEKLSGGLQSVTERVNEASFGLGDSLSRLKPDVSLKVDELTSGVVAQIENSKSVAASKLENAQAALETMKGNAADIAVPSLALPEIDVPDVTSNAKEFLDGISSKFGDTAGSALFGFSRGISGVQDQLEGLGDSVKGLDVSDVTDKLQSVSDSDVSAVVDELGL